MESTQPAIEEDNKFPIITSEEVTNLLAGHANFLSGTDKLMQPGTHASCEGRLVRVDIDKETAQALGLKTRKINCWLVTGMDQKTLVVVQPVSLFANQRHCLGYYFDSVDGPDSQLRVVCAMAIPPKNKEVYYQPQLDLTDLSQGTVVGPEIYEPLLSCLKPKK